MKQWNFTIRNVSKSILAVKISKPLPSSRAKFLKREVVLSTKNKREIIL